MTIKQKIENFWYHYKWHTILSLAVAFALAVGVTQCATRVKYDQTCILYCDRVVPDNTVAALERQLQALVTDADGNGEALLELVNVSYDADSTAGGNLAMTNSQKLMAMTASADYALYVVDAYGYDRLMKQENMQLFEQYDFLPHQNGTAWNWKGSALQKALQGKNLPENLYFCIRKVAGTSAETDEKAQEQARLAEHLVQALIARNR